jgi:hypothetical protein
MNEDLLTNNPQTGQVMNAFVHSRNMRPISTANGFIVDSDAFYLFDACECTDALADYSPKPVFDVSSYFTYKHIARVAREAFLSSAFLNEEDDLAADQTFDSSISTLDSFGPCTPLHSRSGSTAIPTPIDHSIVFSVTPPSSLNGSLVFSRSANFLDNMPPTLTPSDVGVKITHRDLEFAFTQDIEEKENVPTFKPIATALNTGVACLSF